jgi:rod shape-determining protein MreC
MAHGLNNGYNNTVDFFHSFGTRRSLAGENLDLHSQLDSAQRELARLRGVENELKRLAEQYSYARRRSENSFVADVVLNDPASWLRSLVLYTGETKAEKNLPVAAAEGLVGRVILPIGPYAKVLLITDRSSSVSAMVSRTRRKGIVRGTHGNELDLQYILLQDDVQVGDQVVTAGLDGIFPRDIPIGWISSVEAGNGLFHQIQITPAVDFWHLDRVDVLTLESVPRDVQEALSDGSL